MLNKRVIPSMFVPKIKINADGAVDRLKARLVALGCLQR